MSAPAWRQFFGYNRYTAICGRATRSALKEGERVKAERRGETSLRYQEWKDGKPSEQIPINKPQEKSA